MPDSLCHLQDIKSWNSLNESSTKRITTDLDFLDNYDEKVRRKASYRGFSFKQIRALLNLDCSQSLHIQLPTALFSASSRSTSSERTAIIILKRVADQGYKCGFDPDIEDDLYQRGAGWLLNRSIP